MSWKISSLLKYKIQWGLFLEKILTGLHYFCGVVILVGFKNMYVSDTSFMVFHAEVESICVPNKIHNYDSRSAVLIVRGYLFSAISEMCLFLHVTHEILTVCIV